ncbi:GTP-binding protein EngA [Anaerohalosphaera lusitana]|uniref:GTP-binding protein EngA n=1 Tax=Anaerohalosphaera lusitana TaxID=1936003 RepID=A0A1U9NK30_9BACT|nr:[FeFe] hydrogenase H-cluster maturation GTPase HydF [Anaerohalosphaera lusitana]AQT68281.1 GTP-binding protein EngA [Anaerohalosphaera lusitana]
MLKTPKALRLHIGIFGRRNVGKSSVLNSLLSQQVSIVSEVAGTTTDPVEKVMELQPVGPVVFVDTAGIDDIGALGKMRVDKTYKAIEKTDLALVVTDRWQEYEQKLCAMLKEQGVPVIVVTNKADLRNDGELEEHIRDLKVGPVVATSIVKDEGISRLRQQIIEISEDVRIEKDTLLGGLVNDGDTVVLVVPIDIEAPKGRLILAQVQTLREVLDANCCAMVVKENMLEQTLTNLKQPPALVVTDSQAFAQVSKTVPADIPLTGFSVLFARYKGDLCSMVEGAMAIEELKGGDKVLISEACSHHPIGEDIGRIKIPRWLQSYVGDDLDIEVAAGRDFPEDLSDYKLVIHCGACVWNRRQVLSRIDIARKAQVPFTNYGLTIAYSLGVFERALQPFDDAMTIYKELAKK